MALITQHGTLARLATEILIETQKLMGQEFVSVKEELAPNWARAKKVICCLFLATIVLLASVVLLSLTLAHLLVAATTLEPWLCEFIIMMGFVFAAVSLLAVGLFHFRKLDFIPRMTLENFKENMQCLKDRI